MARPRLCIDRALPDHLTVAAAHHAASENPRNIPDGHPWSDGVYHPHPLSMALQVGKTWEVNKQLAVYFYPDVSQRLQVKILAEMVKWSQYANVGFRQVQQESGADCRITTAADPGSWSMIGPDSHMVPLGQPTMNYGWLDDSTPALEVQRVVLHETGHLLGCVHEHQNPTGGLVWNQAQVIRDYEGPPNGWTPDEIVANVLRKYDQTQLFSSSWDGSSIMEYPIAPGEATTPDGRPVVVGWNQDFSAEDKLFIPTIYPFPDAKPGPTDPPVQPPVQPPTPPSPPLYPTLSPAKGPLFARIAIPGQVVRFDLKVPAAMVVEVLTSPMLMNITVAGLDDANKVYLHGRGFAIGRLPAGDYLLSVAAIFPTFTGDFGVACRPLAGLLGLS